MGHEPTSSQVALDVHAKWQNMTYTLWHTDLLTGTQDSYWSSVAKFPNFSGHRMTISLT